MHALDHKNVLKFYAWWVHEALQRYVLGPHAHMGMPPTHARACATGSTLLRTN